MQRLLLYVHYNKFNFISGHVLYQLENIRPLYSRTASGRRYSRAPK